MKQLPLGIQNFPEIIENDLLYVDKTPLAKKLIEKGKHYFLSRPRRFGKSLFLSTLQHIFQADKELFKGLAIERSDYKWEKHPVLYFDFSKCVLKSPELFEQSLLIQMKRIAKKHNIEVEGFISDYLGIIIEELSEVNSVVVLIDEYDKPILDHLKNPKVVEEFRTILRDFFSTLKSLDKYLRFTFVTGVSRFSKASLFSGFNNLTDISFKENYAAITGYTEEELDKYFPEYVNEYAKKNKETPTEVRKLLKTWYNGYRFTENPLKVYNPYSTLSFFDEAKAKNFWYNSGTPTFLITLLAKKPTELLELSNSKASFNTLSSVVDTEHVNPISLMYQSGYLTIKDYIDDKCILDFPNREVRESLFEALLLQLGDNKAFAEEKQVKKAFEEEDIDSLVKLVNKHFAKLSYNLFKRAQEGFFHAIFFSILQFSGLRVYAEISTNIGRIDLVVEEDKVFYIIECKLDKSAKEAMNQIKNRGYLEPFFNRGKKGVAFGLNFSSEKRYLDGFFNRGKKMVAVGLNFESKKRHITESLIEEYSEDGKLLKP